jgi:hypothetical protein
VTAGAVAGSARLRRWHSWPAGLAALVVVTGAGAGLWLVFGSGPASSGQAARRLLRASLAAAEAAGSFHYVASSTSAVPGGPALTQRTAGDAAQHGGTQTITVSGDTFHVEVLGPVAYFRGDAPAMVQVLGVPPAVAQAYAGRWISLVAGDGPYSSVQVAVTAPSALAQNITFEAETQLPPSTLDGRRVIGLRGPMTAVQGQVAHGSATLYVSASGAHLPVRYVEHGTLGSGSRRSSEEFSITFSAWGEAVPLSAPPGAVPFSSLGVEGAGPSGPTLIT